MESSSSQIRQIVDRLIEKTSKAELRWSEGFGRSSISTRLGDYQIGLSRPYVGADVEMTIGDIANSETIKIGGSFFGGGPVALPGLEGVGASISREDQLRLNKLFENITKESPTLSGLLKALG